MKHNGFYVENRRLVPAKTVRFQWFRMEQQPFSDTDAKLIIIIIKNNVIALSSKLINA